MEDEVRTAGSTLWERWSYRAQAEPKKEAVVVLRAGEEPFRWHWCDLISEARAYARWLRSRGVQPGETCAIIARHHEAFYPLYLGVVGAGAIPAVLAYPNARLHPDKFREGLRGMSRYSGLDWILTERDLETTIRPILESGAAQCKGILFAFDSIELAPETSDQVSLVSPDSPALLQHSSGTTGLQKAVVLSHRAVLDHVGGYATALAISPHDRIVSWLPLYHDMGLIAAFHLPLACGVTAIHLDPFEWVTAPVLLIEALCHERGTLSWLPNFAYALMGNRVRADDLEGLDLSHVRMLINCSEPVRHESHQLFLKRFEPVGIRERMLGASYAMAEATFAVTQTPPGAGCQALVLSREALAQGSARAPKEGETPRTVATSGSIIPGCAIRIVDEQEQDVADAMVGEVLIRSNSLFDGYRNQSEKTAQVLRDGWYHSGDLAFVQDASLYVVGRKKDLIIVAGKNLYPEDVEDAISSVPGALQGRSVAFGVDDAVTGTERVCAIVETTLNEAAHHGLKAEIVAAVQRIDITLSEVHLVPARWLIKSSSGKPSRAANRERILSERSVRQECTE